jgi:hypothetical protein
MALPPAVYNLIATFLRFSAPEKDQIYAVGGRKRHLDDISGYLDEVEMFDWFRFEWRALAPISVKRVGGAVVCVDGCLYVAGGYCSRISQPVSSVEKYDPETEEWATVAPMLGARYGHAMATLDGKIYVMGGDAGGNDRMLSSCEMYDPKTDVWSEIARLPVKLAGGRVQVYGKNILYVGGCAEASLSDVVWSYSTEKDIWEPYARMSVGRSAFALGRLENGEAPALVVAGGFLDEDVAGGRDAAFSAELVSLDTTSSAGSPRSDEGTPRTLPPLPEQRSGCGAVTVKRDRVMNGSPRSTVSPDPVAFDFDMKGDECLVLLGGEEMSQEKDATTGMFNTAWIFDSRAWSWVASEVLPPMLTGRTALGICIAPGYPRSYGFYAEEESSARPRP